MRHRAKGRQLSRTASHKKATLNNMASSLFEHGGINTTVAKAKELRPFAERLITLARRGGLHARRLVERRIKDKAISHKLFAEIGKRFAARPGGYTRIVKLGHRVGDGARGGPRTTGGPGGSPCFVSSGRFRDLVRLEAAGAHADAPHCAIHDGSHALQVGVPAAVRLIVRVADVVPRHGALATDLTHSSHGLSGRK
jgi:large subunit ribosomal protein L17